MFIYLIKVNNDIRYIGKTTVPLSVRLYQHIRNAKQGKKTPLYDLLRKYIEQDISIESIENVNSENWQEREIFYIKKYRDDGYRIVNVTDGGDGVSLFGDKNGMYGKKHSSESIEKMKLNRSGISPWNKGIRYKLVNPINKENKVRGVYHHNSKLDDDKVREIRNLRKYGISFQKIANIYGVSKTIIISIIKCKTWKHVI